MKKTIKIYGIIFFVVLTLLSILEISKKELMDWRKNYDIQKKTPFGMWVFQNEIEEMLQSKVIKLKDSPYNYYTKNNKKKIHNILIFNQEIPHTSFQKILKEVENGSCALFVSEHFSQEIADSLGFYLDKPTFEDNQTLFLTDKNLKSDSLFLDKEPGRNLFTQVHKNTQILGGTKNSKRNLGASFIAYQYGQGKIYLHSEPLFITNYYLLKNEGEKYAEKVFSYLPKQETLWFLETQEVIKLDSPLRFILSKPALKYAWWVLLFGMLIFIIFNSKRKQRVVPIISPLANKSVEFVKSISNLYLQEGDFHEMMAKKAKYFLHKTRTELHLDTQNLNEEFAKKLHLKTGHPIEKIIEAIELIKKAQDPYSHVVQNDLFRINTLLDEIFRK